MGDQNNLYKLTDTIDQDGTFVALKVVPSINKENRIEFSKESIEQGQSLNTGTFFYNNFALKITELNSFDH